MPSWGSIVLNVWRDCHVSCADLNHIMILLLPLDGRRHQFWSISQLQNYIGSHPWLIELPETIFEHFNRMKLKAIPEYIRRYCLSSLIFRLVISIGSVPLSAKRDWPPTMTNYLLNTWILYNAPNIVLCGAKILLLARYIFQRSKWAPWGIVSYFCYILILGVVKMSAN